MLKSNYVSNKLIYTSVKLTSWLYIPPDFDFFLKCKWPSSTSPPAQWWSYWWLFGDFYYCVYTSILTYTCSHHNSPITRQKTHLNSTTRIEDLRFFGVFLMTNWRVWFIWFLPRAPNNTPISHQQQTWKWAMLARYWCDIGVSCRWVVGEL